MRIKKFISIVLILTIVAYSLLTLFNNKTYATSQWFSSDIDGIDESLYPGFKEKIKSLQAQYPNWNFQVLYTNLDWSEVIANEYVGHNSGPRNMIQAITNYQGQWICPICSYENSNWKCASQDAIKYMMDPRNSLNASDIFQFEELTINGCDINAINSMVSGTFLQGHANEIANAANNTGINPYYIIARLIQEQGRSGSATSSGASGYYNPFNIGATGNSDAEEIENAINYAKNHGWNTLEKALIGGINFLTADYIKQGQNTLYFQKFDVEDQYNGLYWHQYMQNLMAAQSEGNTLRKTYVSINSIGSEHTFIIPLYKNMPTTACSRPDGSANATVSGDIVKVNANGGLNLRSTPNGSRTGSVSNGEIVTRIEKATTKIAGTYWDKVRKANGVEGYVARETYDYESEYKLYLLPLTGDSDSNTGNTGSSDTGNEGNTGNSGNTTNYKLGDVNGDNKLDSMDMYELIQYILGNIYWEEDVKEVADMNKDNIIDSMDMYLLIQEIINE